MSFSKTRQPGACALGLILYAMIGAAHAQPSVQAPDSKVVSQVQIEGLVFLAAPEKVVPRGLSPQSIARAADGSRVDVSQSPALQDPRFVSLMSSLIGRPLTDETIQLINASVNAFLQAGNQGLAYVGVPPQDASSGVVQVLVLQSKLGKLTIEGASFFPEDGYRSAIRQQPGSPIDQARLDEDLAWIQRANPFRSAVAVTSAGTNVGETDIAIRVSEQKPWSVRLSVDNTGVASTQKERVGLSASYGNMFGLGHVGTYGLTASPDFKSFVGHNGTYVIPLASRDLLSLSASYADIRARVPTPLDSKGYSSTVGARYEMPLAKRGTYSHSLLLGADYKVSDTNLLFSATPVFNNTTNIFQWIAGYTAAWQDSLGRTSLNATVAYSPGGVGGHNRDANFAATRAGAKAQYNYESVTLDRITYLPRGWEWALNARLQIASENLLGSEQLAATGTYGVRGFEEGLLYADRGVIVRNEILPPEFSLQGVGRARLYGFVDAAGVSNVNRLPGERGSNSLSGAGLGAKMTIKDRLSVRVEVGKALSSNFGTNISHHWRGHVGLSVQF